MAVIRSGEGFDDAAVSSAEAQVIVISESTAPRRQRFTLAHELAHLLSGDQDVHLDKDIYDRSQSKDPREVRANIFAAAFLMPEQVLRAAVGTADLNEQAFAALACGLMVSPPMLAGRVGQLGLIDAGTRDRLKRLNGAKAAGIVGRNYEFARSVAKATTLRGPGLLLSDSYAAYEAALPRFVLTPACLASMSTGFGAHGGRRGVIQTWADFW